MHFGDLAKIKAFFSTFCSDSPKHLAQCGCSSVTPVSICRTCRFDLCHCPSSGYIFVDFSSEEEVKKALKCNRDYMGKGPGAGHLRVVSRLRSFVHSFTPQSFIEGLLCSRRWGIEASRTDQNPCPPAADLEKMDRGGRDGQETGHAMGNHGAGEGWGWRKHACE